jgi:hypothetical protein
MIGRPPECGAVRAAHLLAIVLLILAVRPFETGAQTFVPIGSSPADSRLSAERANSSEAQGIAFSGSHWYYSNRWTIYRLSPDFRASDQERRIAPPFGVRFGDATCDHVGGLDFYDGELYAALEGCSDHQARVAVFDADLCLKRSATLPELEGGLAYVAVNPLDDAFFYTEARDKRGLIAFPRNFAGSSLTSVKTVRFSENPGDVLADYWTQGGAFSTTGLFFRVVDDAHDDDSSHTGVWIYEIVGTSGRRTGFINIRYDPDRFAITNWRNEELEDIDASSIATGATRGDVHVLLLNNEVWGEDRVSVLHFARGLPQPPPACGREEWCCGRVLPNGECEGHCVPRGGRCP